MLANLAKWAQLECSGFDAQDFTITAWKFAKADRSFAVVRLRWRGCIERLGEIIAKHLAETALAFRAATHVGWGALVALALAAWRRLGELVMLACASTAGALTTPTQCVVALLSRRRVQRARHKGESITQELANAA